MQAAHNIQHNTNTYNIDIILRVILSSQKYDMVLILNDVMHGVTVKCQHYIFLKSLVSSVRSTAYNTNAISWIILAPFFIRRHNHMVVIVCNQITLLLEENLYHLPMNNSA